eukprot:GHVU01103567.1.p1 GENE.GHVU01103567.1~~GHVU01103567.1.p1  ORF type:complete len:156 (+),score=10.99 GHVU01103567.1:334-801(+)
MWGVIVANRRGGVESRAGSSADCDRSPTGRAPKAADHTTIHYLVIQFVNQCHHHQIIYYIFTYLIATMSIWDILESAGAVAVADPIHLQSTYATHTHTYIYTHTHTYANTHLYTYTHIHTHTWEHAHTRTHTHTHTQTHLYTPNPCRMPFRHSPS